MEKIFFLNTYRDYHTNGSNRSYWAKFFKLISEDLQEKEKMRLHSSFNENMPIYEYYSAVKNRFVRIMQYDPMNEIVRSERYSANRFYTAWLDERSDSLEGEMEPELVVCLLMTKTNVDKAERLIRAWLFGSEEKTIDMIGKIYMEQERMDKENEE